MNLAQTLANLLILAVFSVSCQQGVTAKSRNRTADNTGSQITVDSPQVYTPQAGDPNISTAVNLSATSPLIQMTNDQTECHRRLADGQTVRNRGETVLYTEGVFEFFIVCNYGKWNMARASWNGTDPAQWIDYDPSLAGIQPMWSAVGALSSQKTNSAGNEHFEHPVHLALLINTDATVEGIYWQSSSTTIEHGIFRVAETSLAAMSSTSVIDQGTTAKNWLIANATDSVASYPNWSTFDLATHGGNKYVSWEYSSGYETGIAIKQYTDMATLTIDTPEIVIPGLRHGYIVSHAGKIYLMAYDPEDAAWKMTMADSVANLDWSRAIDLKLRDLFGEGSGWSEVAVGLRNRVNRMPDVFGFDFHNERFHFFYRSGEYQEYSSTDPDTGDERLRGIGVVRMDKVSG